MLEVQHDGGVATVRFDHGRVNAMDLELLEATSATVGELDADGDVGAIVLTGNGRAFSAGVDLRRILAGGADETERFLGALSDAFLVTLRCGTPTVAAVDGHAIAGGAVLAAACDRVLASDDPRIRVGLAELAVGVPFPPSAIEIVRRRLGTHLSEVVLTARTYPVAEARDLGFLDELVPADELLDRAREAATALAAVPAHTMALTKRQLRSGIETALAATGADGDREVTRAWSSDHVRAAVAAFVERTLGPRSD